MRVFGLSSRAAGMSGGIKMDPACGFVLCPNLRMEAIPGFFPEIRTNSWGMRDREYLLRKPPGTLRVLALGDSFAYGRVDIAFNFLTILENQLNQKFSPTRIEILNTGVPAYQPVNESTYLRAYGFRFEPDLVLLCFYVGNDLRENDRPPTELDPTNPIRQSKERAEALPLYSWFSWSELYWTIASAVSRASLVSEIRHRISESKNQTSTDPRLIRPDFAFMSPDQYRETLKTQIRNHLKPRYQNDWDRNNFSSTQKIIEEMARNGRARNIFFAVALLPSEVQVDSEVRKEFLETAQGIITPEEMDFEEPQKTLLEILKASNIPVVDLLPEFIRFGQSKRLYLLRDTHWNEEGNALAAAIMLNPLGDWLQSMKK